nr:EamA family transporter [Capnocytophaga canimorsus]
MYFYFSHFNTYATEFRAHFCLLPNGDCIGGFGTLRLFFRKFKFIHSRFIYPTLLCGVIFALDITVWNISIQNSSATQATLLTNLSPVWVGIISFLFLK